MSNIDDLEGLCTSLRDNSATLRRKAIKEILEIIEKDSNRFIISALGEGKPNMWVRLVKNAKLAVDKEVATADKKGRNPRNDEANFLWKILQLADDKTTQLGPVVAELLSHVVAVLEDDLAREAYGKIYIQALCKVLEEPEYCEQISPKLFENTVHTLLRVLRMSQESWDARQQRGVAAYARGLQLLLGGYGKDIHEFLEPLVDFFSQWCASMDKGCDRGSTGALKAIASVFEALSTLLQLYGTACAPMLRQYGREVLDFVLRRFPSAQRTQRGYMVEYIRLHLRVAGAAKEGSKRGERDPIFDAVPNLYRLLVNEQEIAGAVGSAALHRIGGGGPGSRRRGAGLWLSLERRGRVYLLLCADLVRFYREVSDASAPADWPCKGGLVEDKGNESDRYEDGVERVAPVVAGRRGSGKRKARNNHGSADRGVGRETSSMSPSSRGGGGGGARKRSRAVDPWEDILGALNGQAPLPLVAAGGRACSLSVSGGTSNSKRRSPANPPSVGPLSGGDGGRRSGAAAPGGVATNPVHSLPWLQVLAAVLEAYPAGGCWRPEDTAIELARIVLAVDAHLKSTSDSSVHLWALVCLLRAAEASGSYYLSRRLFVRGDVGSGGVVGNGAVMGGGETAVVTGEGEAAAAATLAMAWRSAWATLLRADQRFCTPTGRCERHGVGEAVVAVLGACMREGLVEPGFVTKEQDRLWALPLFRSPASASCSAEPFRLVTAFLRRGDLLEGRDSICTHMQAHPGPGAMTPNPATPSATSIEPISSDGIADGIDETADPGEATAAGTARPRRGKACRQNRRRWRLLQYVLGWMEAAAVEGGGRGSSSGISGGCSIEAEDAWAAAAAALVAITCSGPPPGPAAAAAASARADGELGEVTSSVVNYLGCRRPFLLETSIPPCPFFGAAVACRGGDDGGAGSLLRNLAGGGGGAIADGVWVGVLDGVGPFLRQGGGVRPSSRRGGVRGVWSSVGTELPVGPGGEVELPAFVVFMSPTLQDCEPRPETSSSITSPNEVAAENPADTFCGVRLKGDGMASSGVRLKGEAGGSCGGSNMIYRDDTAAMHRLIAQWVRREAEELAGSAVDLGMPPAERARPVRALMRCVCVLATFFSHAYEAGVEHPEPESALWAAAGAASRALEHAARAADYETLCEGLARLHRVVASLLDWMRRSPGGPETDQSDAFEGGGSNESESRLADILRFCSRLVKDWHKGNLPETAPAAPTAMASAAGRPGYHRGSVGGACSRSSNRPRPIGSNPSAACGGGRTSPAQSFGGFSEDGDDMMEDDEDSFASGPGAGGSAAERAGSVAGGLGFLPSQYSSSQGSGGGGGGRGRGTYPSGAEAHLFGEGKDPGGALKGALVWCARLSLIIGPNQSSAKKLLQFFEKAYKDAAVDEAELFAVATEAAQACRSVGSRDGRGGETGVNGNGHAAHQGGLAGGLSLVRSAVDLVLAYADPDDRSSGLLLRLLGAIQQAVVARGSRRASPPPPLNASRSNRSGGGGSAGVYDDGEHECLARLADAVFKDKMVIGGAKHSRLVRAARISAARAVFDACPDSAVRDDFAACIFAGTTDPDAGVRSSAVGATRVLFRRFLPARHPAIFATLLSKLPPVVASDNEVEVEVEGSPEGDGKDNDGVVGPAVFLASEQAFAKLSKGKSENAQRYYVTGRREFEATSLVTVADMAVSSDRVTRSALYHLLRRSVRPELAAAIRRLIERLARALGFACGPALLRDHLMFFMSEWLKERSSLEGFPFELLGHARRGGEDGALRACAHVAVPLAVVQLSRQHRLREVQSMAEELGMGATDSGVARLVRLHVADIKAAYLPLLYTEAEGADEGGRVSGNDGVEADRRVASEADDFLQRVIAGDKAGKTSDNLQTLVLRLLDMGVVEPFGAFGRVTLKSISNTLDQVARQLNGGSGTESGGAGDLLRRINFVEVILHVRRHIARARGAEAQRRTFGVLEFVLTEAAVQEDAGCLSGTVTVLLWLLEARSSELIAATATTSVSVATAEVERRQGAAQASGASASEGGVGATPGDASRGDGEGIVNGGAASVVRLMRDVFDRCMASSKGQKLLGRHLGAVVEGLVGAFVDLREAQARLASTGNLQGRGFADLASPEDMASDEDDDFEITPVRSSATGLSPGDRRRKRGGGGEGVERAQNGPRASTRPGSAGCGLEWFECERVADLVFGLLKALVVDSPASMFPFVARLHPFTNGAAAASADLETLSRALAARARGSTADASTPPGRGASADAGEMNRAMDADGAAEVWQAAERLVDASACEGALSSSSSSPSSSTSSPSRTAGSLLASLSHMRGALRRCTNGGNNSSSSSSDRDSSKIRGAWEVMSSGPKGVALARAAVGAVVRICRSERPADVHLEAARLAGEIGAVDPYDVELAERASARGGGRLEGLGSDSTSKDPSGSLGDPLAVPKLRALRMMATYLKDGDADLSSCALCTAKALLSREGSNDHVLVLLKASPSEVQALLEPFTARLAQMNTARMSARVWSGLFGRARSGGRGDGGSRGVADIARAERSAMSAEVWTTEGKTFPQWVCGLTSALLLECYAGVAFRCFEDASSEDPTYLPRPLAPQGTRQPLVGQDETLALFYALCRRKAELATCLFPAIVYDLVRSHEDSEDIGDDGGGKSDNRAALELSAAFREHIFALDEPVRGGKAAAAAARRPNPQAVALGVEALNYLRGRQVASFLRHHNQQGRRSRKSTATGGTASAAAAAEHASRWLRWEGEGRGNDHGSGLPFGYYLDLDPLVVARAAARCSAHCSALFYAEAWIEGQFGEAAGIAASRWRDEEGESGWDGLDGSGDSGVRDVEDWGDEAEDEALTPWKRQSRRQGEGEARGKAKEKREVERLLLEVFSSLPEPDSIYGVPAPAGDLAAQAMVYAHEGGWGNTLPSYDTLLQQQQPPSLGSGSAATVTGGFSGVGSLSGNELQTGIAASLQRMGLRHVLECYLRGLRVEAASVRDLPDLDGDLREMQFESAWRMCEWDPALVATSPFTTTPAGTGAPTEVDGASTRSLAEEAGSISTYSNTAAGWTSFGSGSIGGGLGGGRPVFNEHILQALGSLRQRNSRVFGASVENARSLALMRLGSGGGGQEGGKGLYPCLVQLQCIAELEEAFAVLSSAAGAEGESSKVMDDAAEVLMERWRARSTPVEEHFESLEPVLALRESMVRVLHHERPGRRSRRLVLRHLLDVSLSARRVGHHSIAQGALHRFLQVSRTRLQQDGARAPRAEDRAAEAMRCRLAEARVLWGKGETDGALRAARAVATRLKASVGGSGGAVVAMGSDLQEREEQRLLSEALRLTGAWMSKTKSESSREILHSYLNPAVEAALAGGGAALIPSASALESPGSGMYGDIENDGCGGSYGRRGWGGEGPRPLLCAAHFTLAEYLAGLYASVRGRVESSEWCAAGRVAENRARELASCIKKLNDAKRKGQLALGVDADYTNLYRYAAVLKKEDKLDKDERAGVEQSVGTFLIGALQNFGKSLAASREPDLRAVFTVMSLWFNNQSDVAVNKEMHEITRTVPSYKFIPLTYQISSRVGSGDDARFRAGVHRLILRLCREHPHHSLLQLLALANGENVSGQGATQFKRNVSTEKIQAAKGLLHELKMPGRDSASLTVLGAGGPGPAASAADMPALVPALERLVEAYIELAMADTTKYHNKKTGGILFSAAIPKGRPTLDRCLRDRGMLGASRASEAGTTGRRVMPGVVTRPPPVRPDADYRGMPTISGFQPSFSITDSGIHRPKIVHCLDSAGGCYRQLVKGADDIRQDAVMEQVFATVNSFLREDPAARKRRLRVFTYTIIPLSPDSGVLEWVEDTMPFGSFLTDRGSGKPAAHRRYFPNDWSHTKCRTHMKNAVDKRRAYSEVEDNFHPAFRFFFMENFPEPFTWYNSRLTFTRSAAVSSIVGYVLGIGDRHAHNILVHQRTAEVVHIDFGVTFEQGKALSTPETVPFRLTRDVVDGMGVTGTEGAFRRACETAMRVLRFDASSVLTILEVLLHDPLYRWMLSPYAARQRQQDEDKGGDGGGNGAVVAAAAAAAAAEADANAAEDSGAGGDAAQRALARIKHKLQGYEDPNGDAMSVEGQVKLLINQARDPENLCRLYPGWAPWL